ncbi:MAG: cellulase family glycosylhydrolase, partial [Bacteroidales bacterium]|nr:cellulase family glycosylhydrolase [Bacteroidales bacterium]
INQLEMWQAETFDPASIDKELALAESIGFNTMRVFLHNLVWAEDSVEYLERIDKYLSIADKHKIKTIFVFFDNCWNPVSKQGKQPEPFPFRHNSGWVQSPSVEMLKDTTTHPKLAAFVRSIISRFKDDNRILMWDIYNEPGNVSLDKFKDTELAADEKAHFTMLLLRRAFSSAREARPSQPLTAAVWMGDWSDTTKLTPLDKFMLNNSDIISFHNYDSLKYFKRCVEWLKVYNRPIICTEYMARPRSTFTEILPYAKENRIGVINWGLVSGKTQTIFPWHSWKKQYTVEPVPWFHDVFRLDGTAYDTTETNLIKKLNSLK